MKRLAIILGLLSVIFLAEAQFPLDSVAFKAYQLDIFYGSEDANGNWTTYRKETEMGESILYFTDGRVSTTNLEGQLSSFQFYPNLEYFDDPKRPSYEVNCLDAGFYKCLLTVYSIPEKNDKYLIRIDYSNVRFGFHCRVTNERPADSDYRNHPLTPHNLIEDGKTYRNDPDYTDAELIEFFNQFGNGKLILSGIKNSFFAGNLD